MSDTSSIDRVRARSFGAAAANYDRYRPRYPEQLVDDVVAMVPGRRVLEVGAGTGIATAAFAARGVSMTCVEPDPEMAAVLSAKLAGVSDLHAPTTDVPRNGRPRTARRRTSTSPSCACAGTGGRAGCRWPITWSASTPRRRT